MKKQFPLPELFLATENQGKIRELKKLLADFAGSFHYPGEFPDLTSPPESGKSYYENALIKALYYSKRTGLPALADDSGLEIDYLDGQPGIKSSRFLGENTTFAEKMKHIITMLDGISEDKRGARFVCCAVLAFPDGEIISGQGSLYGRIGNEMMGEGGFGYDPIFLLPGKGITVAMVSEEDKNKISHRALAIKDLLDKCKMSGDNS